MLKAALPQWHCKRELAVSLHVLCFALRGKVARHPEMSGSESGLLPVYLQPARVLIRANIS